MALTYDSGDYFTMLEMALKAADYTGFEQRRQEAARQGKLRGIGIATYIEQTVWKHGGGAAAAYQSALKC